MAFDNGKLGLPRSMDKRTHVLKTNCMCHVFEELWKTEWTAIIWVKAILCTKLYIRSHTSLNVHYNPNWSYMQCALQPNHPSLSIEQCQASLPSSYPLVFIFPVPLCPGHLTCSSFSARSYLINQMLCHKFFTEPSNYSLLLAQEFAGVYFRVSTILGQYLLDWWYYSRNHAA